MMETQDVNQPTSEANEGQVVNRVAKCPGCGARTILFSATIQTYCYRCGLPVTQLDQAGMFYEQILPDSEVISDTSV